MQALPGTSYLGLSDRMRFPSMAFRRAIGRRHAGATGRFITIGRSACYIVIAAFWGWRAQAPGLAADGQSEHFVLCRDVSDKKGAATEDRR